MQGVDGVYPDIFLLYAATGVQRSPIVIVRDAIIAAVGSHFRQSHQCRARLMHLFYCIAQVVTVPVSYTYYVRSTDVIQCDRTSRISLNPGIQVDVCSTGGNHLPGTVSQPCDCLFHPISL